MNKIDPITEYILLERGWPDETFGHIFKDAHTKFSQTSSLQIMKCREKYGEGSDKEQLCSYMASLIDEKKYLKWVQRKGPGVCKKDKNNTKKCIKFMNDEIKRMTNIINTTMTKLKQFQKKR